MFAFRIIRLRFRFNLFLKMQAYIQYNAIMIQVHRRNGVLDILSLNSVMNSIIIPIFKRPVETAMMVRTPTLQGRTLVKFDVSNITRFFHQE